MTQEIMVAIINEETNIVENVIVIGGVWQAPKGFYMVVTPDAKIGDTYDKNLGVFVMPEQEGGGVVEQFKLDSSNNLNKIKG